ncbi:MAG TPA: acyltransferase [Steroidobacteraceae bacterium]
MSIEQDRSARVQIRNLTGIRGIAALWVALYHFQATAVVVTLPLGPIVGGGAIGVDIFFVLSGFILALTYAPRFALRVSAFSLYYKFIARRFARIYPLHLATFLLILLFWGVAVRAGYDFQGAVQNDLLSALCNLFMVHAWGLLRELGWNSPSWSVSAEWFAYLAVFPCCVLLLRHWSIGRVLGLSMALWVAFVAYVFVVHGGQLAEVNTDGALRIVPEFIGGYAVYRIVNDRPRRRRGLALICAALAGLATVLLMPAALPLLLPAVLLMMAGLYDGGRWVDSLFGNRVIVWLGEISYSIYMLHVFVLIAANQLVRRLGLAPSTPHALLILGSECAVAMAAGALGYYLLECPARARLTRILFSRRHDTVDTRVTATLRTGAVK